jgi:hypothetical protein
MATDAQTLVNAAMAARYDSLSDRELLLCLAGLYGANAGLNAQQAVNAAMGADYDSLSDRELWECYLGEIS